MDMLERLRITSFQCHERFDVKLDPQITTIVGPSDTGKSAVCRALRWLCLNQPRGDGFVQHGAKGTEVRAKFDDTTVIRKRAGTENVYQVGEQHYRAFGNDRPAQVADLLALDDVNFQGQHDPPFWLSLSPAELGRQLNALVDLDSIDTVAANLRSRITRLSVEADTAQRGVDEANQHITALAFTTAAEAALQAVEGLQAQVVAATQRRATLVGLMGEIRVAAARAKRHLPETAHLDVMVNVYKARVYRWDSLSVLLSEVKDKQTKLTDATKRADACAAALSRTAVGNCPVCGRPLEEGILCE